MKIRAEVDSLALSPEAMLEFEAISRQKYNPCIEDMGTERLLRLTPHVYPPRHRPIRHKANIQKIRRDGIRVTVAVCASKRRG